MIDVCVCGHLKIRHVFWKWGCEQCDCENYNGLDPKTIPEVPGSSRDANESTEQPA